jgi:curved DNA-binding protein CbpA
MADQRGIGATLAQVAELIALPDPDDPFTVLGIPPTTDMEKMRTAYRSRIQEVHPDKQTGNRDEYDRVRKAAEALGIVKEGA